MDQQDAHLYTQMGFWKNRKVLCAQRRNSAMSDKNDQFKNVSPSSTEGVNIPKLDAAISCYYQVAHEGEEG